MLIVLSVNLDLDITHLDITTAFLHGTLDETVYMEQPEAFIEIAKESKVLKLNKAIYGLKQSSRVWYKRVESLLIGLIEKILTSSSAGTTPPVAKIFLRFFFFFLSDFAIFSFKVFLRCSNRKLLYL